MNPKKNRYARRNWEKRQEDPVAQEMPPSKRGRKKFVLLKPKQTRKGSMKWKEWKKSGFKYGSQFTFERMKLLQYL